MIEVHQYYAQVLPLYQLNLIKLHIGSVNGSKYCEDGAAIVLARHLPCLMCCNMTRTTEVDSE